MKILIFGATSYLAKWTIPTLLSAGHEILAVVRSNSHGLASAAGLTILTCASTAESRDLIIDHQPDVVLNMSNHFSKGNSYQDVHKFSEVNTELVHEICMGCVEVGAALFHIGSAWQATFGADDPSLRNSYALHKGLARKIIEWFQQSYSLPALILNLYDTYGPEDPRGKIVSALIARLDSAEPLKLSGGEQIIELVYISDVAEAIKDGIDLFSTAQEKDTLLLTADNEYWCYPTEPCSLKQVVTDIDSISGKKLNAEWGALPYREGELFQRDISEKQVIPGWRQKVSLFEGLEKTLRGDHPRNE